MPVTIQIGDTVLVHGGLRSKHLKYGMQRMNNEMSAWLEGPPKRNVNKPQVIDEPDSPIRARLYSVPTLNFSAGKELEAVLESLGAQRMVVGHTPQIQGINAIVTEGGYEVWRTDTAMSSGLGLCGPLEALEVSSVYVYMYSVSDLASECVREREREREREKEKKGERERERRREREREQ
jgi:hypothetical protein